MTWLLVTTRPEASTMTPEPSERWTCSRGPPEPPPKKRRKIGSSNSGTRSWTTRAAYTFTTAGVTRFTTGAKLNLTSPGDDGTRVSGWAGAVETSAHHTARHP